MQRKTEMGAQLDVAAELNIAVNGSTICVRGNGKRLEADLPNLRTALLIRRFLNGSLMTAHTLLRSRGLALDLRLRNEAIGCMGYGARPTMMGWLAGCAGLELHFFRTLWAVFKAPSKI
jgi:hypothetical protein